MPQVLKSWLTAGLAGLAFIALDQWVKVIALAKLPSESFRYGGEYAWLDIALSLNPGAFLSLGAQLAPMLKQAIFVGAVAMVVGWAIWWALSRWNVDTAKAAAVYLIALGGASNLIDRVYREGHVVDYLMLNLGTLHTGVFNIADIAITGGALYLLFEGIFKPRKA